MGKPYLGRTAAYWEACHRHEGRRQTGCRPPNDQLDGATLLLAPRSVAKQQLQRKAWLVLEKSFGHEFQGRGCCVAGSKRFDLSWSGWARQRTQTGTCAATSMDCACSALSGGSLRQPDGEGRMLISLLQTLSIHSQKHDGTGQCGTTLGPPDGTRNDDRPERQP